MIKLENVSSGYKNKGVLKSISAQFEKEKITAIVGSNGSGKTTLLKTIIGILPLSEGKITVDGLDVCRMKPKERAKRISYLSQGGSTPDMTVGELVTHGRFAYLEYPYIYREKDKEYTKRAMERMGILHLENSPLHTLSGGMRQNAYIAMALCGDSDFILLDEPTAYLDISNKKHLMNTLKALANEGKGIITIVHDLTLAMEYADEIAVIQEGKLIAKNTPEQVYLSGVINTSFDIELMKMDNGERTIYYVK